MDSILTRITGTVEKDQNQREVLDQGLEDRLMCNHATQFPWTVPFYTWYFVVIAPNASFTFLIVFVSYNKLYNHFFLDSD